MGTTSNEHVYDVALSFAGEDRVYVSQVAAALRDAGSICSTTTTPSLSCGARTS